MEMRRLGSSGLSTPPIMLGGNVFGWTADRDAGFAVLDRFVGLGGALIDTADVYPPGSSGRLSEEMIGAWLASRSRRDKVLIATKVGLLGKGLSASRIAAAVDESLARLRIDVIDLYFAHMDDPATPLEETLGAFDQLVRAGKVRAIGASNYSPARLAEALAISDANGLARFSVIEPLYNLIQRGQYEGLLQNLVLAEGLGVVPYYGLATGYLTGKYRTPADVAGNPRERTVAPLMQGDGPAVLAAMDAVAAETGASLATIALAWLMTRPGITAPIASATSPAQVDDIMAAASLTLTAEQLARLDAAIPAGIS